LPDLVGSELREGRHCGASNARANVLEDFAIAGAMFQDAPGEGGRPVASARPRPVAALASSVVYRAPILDRASASGEGILLGLRNVLLCHETAKTKRSRREQTQKTVPKRWTDIPSHLNPHLPWICISVSHPRIAGEFRWMPTSLAFSPVDKQACYGNSGRRAAISSFFNILMGGIGPVAGV
jgi:hypothetical protein